MYFNMKLKDPLDLSNNRFFSIYWGTPYMSEMRSNSKRTK